MSVADPIGGLDPAALQVLIARLGGIAEEMGAVLQRSAFSPNIKERADCSAAVFDARGSLLAQAEHIPVHLGSMPASVSAVLDQLGDRMGPGDQAIVNDPFAGGTHLNDITLVAPCFERPDSGRLIGWVANRAHHADVGGSAPGSIPADATDIHAEGLRIPPVLLTDDVRSMLAANSRTPVERSGDLEAQVGANAVGVARLAELADADFAAVLDHGERRCRSVLGAVIDGGAGSRSVEAHDVLDSTGAERDQRRSATIRVAVTMEPGAASDPADPADPAGAADELDTAGPAVTFDFTGTDPQRWGNTNAVRAVTVSSVAYALRAALDPTLPANDGVMRPVRVVTEPGSLVDARAPVAVGAGNVEVSQRVADVCQLALAELLPGRVPAAGQGTMNNLLIGGEGASDRGGAGDVDGNDAGAGGADSGGPWVYYETTGGGQGGRPPDPSQPGARSVQGQSGIHTAMTNTRNTPIEALERAYPMRVLRCALRRGSGGAGMAPGGDGIERDLLMLEDVTVSLITERRMSAPWGLQGGEAGAVGENWLLPGGDESRAERLDDKCTLRLVAGDVLRILTPGGGGWGAVS